MNMITVARSATLAAGLVLTGSLACIAVAGDTTAPPGSAYAQNERRGGGQGDEHGDKPDANKPVTGGPVVPAKPGTSGRGPGQTQSAPGRSNGADRGSNNRPDRVVRPRPQRPQARNTNRRDEKPVVRNDSRGNDRPATRDNAQRYDRTGADRNTNRPARRYQARYQEYRHNYTSARRFRVDVYRWNSGRSYRRYGYGEWLPNYYYSRNFWLADFILYGLFSPPPGLIWVRYGPDALLIDEETGEIYQVRYNIFYS